VATRAELRSQRGRLTIQAGAGIATEPIGALPDAQIERDVMRAGLDRQAAALRAEFGARRHGARPGSPISGTG